MTSRRRWIFLSVGMGISLLSLWLALRQTDLRALLRVLESDTRIWLVVPFLIFHVLYFWLKALRWKILLSPFEQVTTAELIPPIVLGYAGNLILPAQAGEVARAYLLHRQRQVAGSPVLATIALERLFDVIVVGLLLATAMAASAREFSSLRTLVYTLGALSLAGSIGLGLFVIFTKPFLACMRRICDVMPPRPARWFTKQIEQAARGLEAVRSPVLILKTFVASLAMWGVMATCTYLAIIAITPDAPYTAAVIALAVTVVGLMLPTGPGFVGTIQFCFLLALTPFEIAAEQAIAASVIYNLLITVPPLLVALLYMLRTGRSVAPLRP